MKLVFITILFIANANCFSMNNQNFKRFSGENANEISGTISEGQNHRATILDQFYGYLEKVKPEKEIEKEMELLRENALKSRGSLRNYKISRTGISEDKNNLNNNIRTNQRFFKKDKFLNQEDLKQRNFENYFTKSFKDYSKRVQHQSDQHQLIVPSNEEPKFKRNKRKSSKDISNNSETTNEDAEMYMPTELDVDKAYKREPSRIHISEIKEELNKLQDLVEILRDQQYILSLLNNIDNRDDRLARNSTRVSTLNSMFQNFINSKQEKKPQKESEKTKKQADEKLIKPNQSNLPENLIPDRNSLEVSEMRQEIDQLKTIVLDILKRRKQSNPDAKEKKIAEELEEEKKEISLLKQMITKLSDPKNNDVTMESINETNLPIQPEESDENNRLRHMLEKLYATEEKLNSIMSKQPEQNPSSDEIVASTASTRFKHQNLFPRRNELKDERTFQKNNYLTDFLNKTVVNLHKLRASDSDNKFKHILAALSDNKQETSRKKELIRIQKELASLKTLTQNDVNDDAEDIERLLNDLDIQEEDSLELNSDADIADKILDLEEEVKSKIQTSKKTDAFKTLKELERQFKTLNEKEDRRARLIKLLKKVKGAPESKSLAISEDDKNIAEKLRLLKDAIVNLQPKDDDVSVEEEGKENTNFRLMLQKLISKRKPKPSVAKPAGNKLQSLTNQLATLLNKHPTSVDTNPFNEDTNFNMCPIHYNYGGLNSVNGQNQNADNSFAGYDYGDYRPNYDFAPSSAYDKGKVYNPYKPNFLKYGQGFSTSNYAPNINSVRFPQAIKPYPNRFTQNKINFFDHFPSTYNSEAPYDDGETSTPYYPRPQSPLNFNSKIYPPPQRQYHHALNYKTGTLNMIPNHLFLSPKTNGQKTGSFKTYSEVQKPEPTPYAANAQKYPFDQQQNYQVDEISTRNKIGDLMRQIYNLQDVINNLNRPEYIQKPEDKIMAYDLYKQITDLKNVVNYLSHNTNDYQGPVSKQYPSFPNGNYPNMNAGFKIQVPPNDNFHSQTSNENSDQTYPNVADTSSNVKVNISDLPNYEDTSLHSNLNVDSADQSSYQNSNIQATPDEIYSSDESGTRYERSVDLSPKEINSTDIPITEEKAPPNIIKFESELYELIDDIGSKIEKQASTGTEIPDDFTPEMADHLLYELKKKLSEASLINYFLMHLDKSENSQLNRQKRSATTEENYSSELLSLLLSGNTIDKEFSEETENDEGQPQNLSDLNVLLDQLKSQLDAVPQNSDARASSKQPYQKPNYYYQTFQKTKPNRSLFRSSNKKQSKKLGVFGKIVDKILDKAIDKAPVVVFKLLHRFFGLGSQDLSAQGSNYDGGNLQSFQSFGLSGLFPMVILRIFSNMSYFISQLQRSRFLRNFLVPALILLGVSGLVVFLIWWLQTDNYATQQYSYGEKNDYTSKKYYGNQVDNYGSEYNNNQYENSYSNYRNSYNTNSYGYAMTPYENQNKYKSHNRYYDYNPYLRYTSKNFNRNNYNRNGNVYYYENMLNK